MSLPALQHLRYALRFMTAQGPNTNLHDGLPKRKLEVEVAAGERGEGGA